MKNKIGWCNRTFNPVWGCLNHCEYCYARKIAKRFWRQETNKQLRYELDNGFPDYDYSADGTPIFMKEFRPIFLDTHFNKKFPKKPQRIFVGSMSEIYYWEDRWLEKVLEKVKLYPQHIFQFLTRYPETYNKWPFPEIPENCWLGTTITKMEDLNNRGIYNFIRGYDNIRNIRFVSFEPLLERIEIETDFKTNWVIIGAETGNRKGKIIPKKEWIENIVDFCRGYKIPIYLKDSLIGIYPEEIKEFPDYK